MMENTIQPIRLCSIDGCARTHMAKGFCHRHYERWRTHGDAMSMRYQQLEMPLRFWEKVAITADINRCWLWEPSADRETYGSFAYRGKMDLAHRVAWMLTHGRTPKKVVRHTCDNRCCVNPNHLLEGSSKNNSEDMVARHRQSKGEDRHNSKLNSIMVRLIRGHVACGKRQVEVAKMFGVTPNVICRVIKGRAWQHVQ